MGARFCFVGPCGEDATVEGERMSAERNFVLLIVGACPRHAHMLDRARPMSEPWQPVRSVELEVVIPYVPGVSSGPPPKDDPVTGPPWSEYRRGLASQPDAVFADEMP